MFLLITFLFQSAFSATPPEVLQLRDNARRIILTKSCAQCHDPARTTARQDALRVYNLSEKNWSSTMNDRQLNRLKTFDFRAGPPGKNLTKQERKTLLSFISAEQNFRRKNPNERFSDILHQGYDGVFKSLGPQ